MNEKKIKAVIFDLDDTLIDWSGLQVSYRELFAPSYKKIHHHLTGQGFKLPSAEEMIQIAMECVRAEWDEKKKTFAGANFGDALQATLQRCGVPADQINLLELMKAYDWKPAPGVEPYPDTHEVLTHLKANGYKIGLITNAFQPMWMRDPELEAYDLLKYLDARITSGDTRFMKPHPAIYWRMLGLLDLMPEDCVFVGDRPAHDVQGAHNVGMIGIMIDPPHLDRGFEGTSPDYVINSLSALLPILEELG
ncbi:MAG: putative hydrolase of the HAD superfamily [Cellvibrionaceae bacterium]|jgi:putative hydrolase of the HAD superfamily